MLDGVVADAIPAAGGLELLSEDLLECKGKRKGLLLLPLLDVDGAIVITFEVVGFRLLSKEDEGHDKSRTIL